MFCRTCHYDVRGHTAMRCPECGRSLRRTVSAGALSNILAKTQWPGSHAYLGDFAYVKGLTWSPPAQRGTTVIAYGRNGFSSADPDPRRAVAFMDGHAESLPTSRLQRLLAAQGRALEP